MEIMTIDLKETWAELKQQQPKLRIRNAAAQLGVSEVELLSIQCGENVIRLRSEFREILGEITSLGRVIALTRNEEVVHQRKGEYLNPSLDNPNHGSFTGEDIDLRLFFASWASVFAVKEEMSGKPRYSIQFFANDGEAIHKVYLTSQSNIEAYYQIIKSFTSEDQSDEQIVTESEAPEAEIPDSEIDVVAFREGWLNLKDTNQFSGLIKKHQLTRPQAFRLAPKGNYAVKVQADGFRTALIHAAGKEVPVMVFVGNKGMIQIHTGLVNKLMYYQGWLNVLDPEFNLHVLQNAITDCWVVRKPTEDGVVTAIQCFNAKGGQVMQLFGQRQAGSPEMESWREIVSVVEKKLAKV